MPTQNCSACGRWKQKAIKSSCGRAQSWCRPSRAWEARVECRRHGKVGWKRNKEEQQNDNQHHKNLQVPSLGVSESKVSKMSYSELEPDFSDFVINSLSTFAPIFSESESDDSESDFNSAFINLDICIFFALYLHSSK